jgi:hypothetical protein
MLLQSLLRPVLTPLMRGMFDAPIASSAAWSPLSLWPDGTLSPGMWISPRTLTSEWQDYTGTTQVAVPGTVADSANPVGLAYDLRAGTPVLGPELVTNGDFSNGTTNWNTTVGAISEVAGRLRITSTGTLNAGVTQSVSGLTAGKTYQYLFRIATISNPSTAVYPIPDCGLSGVDGYFVSGEKRFVFTATGTTFTVHTRFAASAEVSGDYFELDNISVREVPGNHMLQSTSSARPLMSAYDGQTLGPGDTYDATGYPIFQKYDGVDDGMATAAFAAGTLTSAMDCMIAVRRDSAAACVAGLYNGIADATKFFGMAESASGSGCVGSGAGTPTVWVDNAQLTGGTAVTRGTLHTALTVGDYHILEFRGLDLSTWTAAGFGLYTSYVFPGARGDILLYPSTASTEDKDAARQWLADYYGVTLP